MIDRYIRLHSDIEACLDLSDFQFYQMTIERVHIDFATGLLGHTGEGLIMTGIYPEGIDLSRKRNFDD